MFWLYLSTDPSLSIVDYISKIGVVALLALIIYGGVKQWWVFGWLYKQERQEKQEWKDIALRSQKVADHSTTITEKLVDGRTNDSS